MRPIRAYAIALAATSAVAIACSSFSGDGGGGPIADDAGSDVVEGDAADAASEDGAPVVCTVAAPSDAGEDASCGTGGLVDLASSDDHCGFCGHACKSTPPACHSGRCDAFTFVDEKLVTVGNADENELFFGHYQNAPYDVKAVQRTGGASRTVATANASIETVIDDGDTVWFSALDGIHRAARYPGPDGGTVEDIALATNVFHKMTLDPSYVYWTADGALIRYDKGAGTKGTIDDAGAGSTIGVVSADAHGVVWSVIGASCAVKTRRATAPNTTAIRLQGRCFGSMTIDATSIWLGEDNRISRMSRDGNEDPVVVATWDGPKKHPVGIVPDGTRVLWFALGDDSGGPDQHAVLFEAPTCGGVVHELVSDIFLAAGAFIDTDYVYVGSGDGILRYAK